MILEPQEALRDLLAGSATFQGWCDFPPHEAPGEYTAEELAALAEAHITLDATDVAVTPLAEIWGENQETRELCPGCVVAFGSLWIRFEGEVPEAYTTEESATSWIKGLVDGIVSELRAGARTTGALLVRDVTSAPSGPVRASDVEKNSGRDVMQFAVRVKYGLDG